MASGNGAQAEVLKKSVTADDYSDGPRAGGVFHFMLPSIGNTSPDLHPYWSYARDWILYSTIYRESMWAAALYIAVTKQASKSFEVESDIPKRQKDAQKLFLSFDNNRGWVGGISKHLQAYLLTGNGGPVEVVRASGAPGSKILGLIPLDPFRTVRTGDPQIPFLYSDRRGGLHEMRAHEAFIIADQPDMMDLWYGVGHCSAERAYQAIIKMEAIERYIYEKVSGKRALALDFVSGVIPTQIEDAKRTAQSESLAKGVTTYMGSTIIALAGDQAPTHVRINLAELPDGFARKEEFDLAILTYARSIGIPVQDLQPLSGQGLGTGTQSQVLDESAKGQGLATWNKAFSHAANEFALDEKTTFYFRENDIRDREREAKVRIDEATAIGTWVTMQAITIEQARQLGVDRDQLPREFIPEDVTAGGSLSDSEKPVDESEVTPEDTALPALTETPNSQDSDAILKSAQEIYHAIRGGNSGESNPRYNALLAQQDKLIDALVTQASVKTQPPDLSESVRKAVEKAMSGTRALVPYVPPPAHSLSGTLDNVWNKIGEVDTLHDDLGALREMQERTEKETQERAERDMQRAEKERALLNATLETLRVSGGDTQRMLGTLRDSLTKESLATTDTLKALRSELEVLSQRPNAPDVKQLQVMVGDMLELERVSYKHAEDLTVKQRISKRDANGLASEVERTLASGQVDIFRVVRSGSGRIEYLERL